MLIVMTGLPVTGKSAIADAIARSFPAPCFSVDSLEATLLRLGIKREQRSDVAAYDLAYTLARSQLRLGQSGLSMSKHARRGAALLPRVAASGTTLTDIFGVGPVIAAMLIGYTGDPLRFDTEHRYAAYNGTAPIEFSSAGRNDHRLRVGGTAP